MKHQDLIVFVIGATGTGKSKLAIDIASHLKGEVINADALQVSLIDTAKCSVTSAGLDQLYTGLDIVTNKVTDEEKNSVKHHLLGFADPLVPLTVVDFRKLALPIVSKPIRSTAAFIFQVTLSCIISCLQINELKSKSTVPVVAGGTMYYMESLLWNVLVGDRSDSEDFLFKEDREMEKQLACDPIQVTVYNVFDQPILASSFKAIPAPELHKILQHYDPEAANTVHPNSKRPIIRCLQVIQRLNERYSEVLKEQRSESGGSSYGGSLRFSNAVIFWTQCEEAVLNQRLDDRVDEMLERGLIQELETFHQHYAIKMRDHGLKADHTQGIFQAIGFKEFHEYLQLPIEKRSEKWPKVCIRQMKQRTRTYAKKQIKWIRNRFIYASNRQIPPIFAVDTTNPSDWDVVVRDRSFQILNHLNVGTELPNSLQPLTQMARPESIRNVKGIKFCTVCDRTFQGTLQYGAHLKSKNHMAMCASKQETGTRECDVSEA